MTSDFPAMITDDLKGTRVLEIQSDPKHSGKTDGNNSNGISFWDKM